MTWRKVVDVAFFILIFVLAINLIENQAESLLVEFAGDLFGALALIFIAVKEVLKD